MIPLDRIGAILLCAGASVRFGATDKLEAPLSGLPLALHAAQTIRSLPFAACFAIVSPATSAKLSAVLASLGFHILINPRPGDGQDSSVRLGLRAVLEQHFDAAMICLGDMPGIDRAHLAQLATTIEIDGAAMSGHGLVRLPPVIIGAGLARRIVAEADRPVRQMLSAYPALALPEEAVLDIDTPADLEQLQNSTR